MHFAYIGNINDLHYLCSLHVLRVKDVFRKFSDVGDGRLARKHALNYKLQVEFANSWNGLRMDCEMEVVGGTGGFEAASEALFSVACARSQASSGRSFSDCASRLNQ